MIADNVMIGDGQVDRIMLGDTEVWAAYEPIAAAGQIGQAQLPNSSTWQTVHSWTCPHDTRAESYLEFTATWNLHSDSHQVQISVNGTAVATSPTAASMGNALTQSVGTLYALAEGDVVQFQARSTNIWVDRNLIASGSWAVTET